MPAKDYSLAVTPLTNTVWICKQSKRNPNTMTDDRVAIDKSKFISILLEWAHNQIDEDSDTLNITNSSGVVATITIDREKLGLK